jgi:PAS domain S-box-containing protein
MLTHENFQEVHAYSANGVIALDHYAKAVFVNPVALTDLFAGDSPIGKAANMLINLSEDQDILSGKLVDEEFYLITINGLKNVLISSTNFTDQRKITRTYLFIRNVSPLKKKEALLSYLNKATEELSQARDTRSALEQISRLIVPKFANWFSIDLFKNGKLEELVLSHEHPDMVNLARKYREAYPTDLSNNGGAAQVIKTGIPSLIPVITPEMIRAAVKSPEQLELIKQMNLQSIITVPIGRQPDITGVISFVSSTTGYHYDEIDLRFAQNFASHVSLSLENARLNEAATREISQRKAVEEQLKITQVHLKSALSSGLVGTWMFHVAEDKLYADENLCRMFGVPYSPAGFDQEIFSRRIHPDDRPLLDKAKKAAIAAGQIYETEYRVIVDGQTYWFFARGQTEAGSGDSHLYFSGVIVDVTGHKQAELALKESEQLFRFLADAIPHKLWTSAPDGSATYYNKGWYEYSGFDNFEELKAKIWDMLHPDDKAIAIIEWPKVIARGEPMQMEQRFRRHDGEYRWHLTRFSAHHDDNGQISLWVGTSTDIHEQKELEHRKDEFLSIASHELKTPLTSIKAFNQIMKRADPPVPLRGFIDKSAEHIYRLEKLISDLLDVTRLNAGKMNYNHEPFSFHQMLRESVDSLQFNTTHEIVLADIPEITYTGDRLRLEQVVNNLLTNAIKYSPNATKIIVEGKVEHDSIIISVQDFGIGIAPENLDRLFDRYYRVDNTAMRFEGLGLGLYISSEILKRHGGSFWIESEQGKGSVFYFRLPLNTLQDHQISVQEADLYQDKHLTIRHNAAKRRLEVDWTGFQDLASVQEGCMRMLAYLERHQVDRIINDNTHVQGNWSDAVDWVGNVWFPMMAKAGLKYFAHLFSPSTFSALSAKKSIDIMAGIITTQYFTDLAMAAEWIDSKPYLYADKEV